MSETKLVRDIQMLSRGDVRLFRNNTGRLQAQDGRWVQFGLCPGSSDLIGWKSVQVTPEMVGRWVAIFVAIEAKSPNKYPTALQHDFMSAVSVDGGLVGFAHSVEDARQVLNIDENGNTLPP